MIGVAYLLHSTAYSPKEVVHIGLSSCDAVLLGHHQLNSKSAGHNISLDSKLENGIEALGYRVDESGVLREMELYSMSINVLARALTSKVKARR